MMFSFLLEICVDMISGDAVVHKRETNFFFALSSCVVFCSID